MMKTNRNDLCSCGSGKKHKKCCLNWRENWVLGIDNHDCEQEVKNIIKGAFGFIEKNNYQGGCHTISAVIHILLNEKGYNSVVRIGEVKIEDILFDHSWVELNGKVIDIAIMDTLQDGIKFPPVILDVSAATGKKVEYQYGVSQHIDGTAQQVLSMSIGQYLMEGVSHGSLNIMRDIAERSGTSLDKIEDTVNKYLSAYRIKSVAISV